MSNIAIDKAQDWRDYAAFGDGLEVAPCIFVGDTIERQDTPGAADFWSVYVHHPEGGVEWIADYDNRHAALRFAEWAVEEYPNLNAFGIIQCWND
jgi:hypothetical protein